MPSIRDWMKREPRERHGFAREGPVSGLHETQTGQAAGRDEDAKAGKIQGAVDATLPESVAFATPDMPDNPMARTIRPRVRGLAKLFQRMTQGRELTPEELADKKERERRALLERTLREEATLYKQRIINALNIRGLCYRFPKTERDMFNQGLTAVEFDVILMAPECFYIHVDSIHRPRGVGILDLMDPAVLTDLSISCGRKVTGEYNEVTGAWYVVERATGVRGIPIHVQYQEMMDAIPQSADELTIPLGMAQNSKRIYRSLKAMPHLLIAGSTDSGKSNMMNVIIGTLISRNTPEMLNFLMVDLKGGMEMTFYEGLPHLVKIPNVAEGGIVYDRDGVPEALDWLIKEGERRMAVIKNGGFKNIRDYNARKHKGKMSRIVLVIDEWADVRLVKSLGSKAEDRLSNLASRMRAVGVHVIVATQSPKKEVISTIIKTNLPAKLAFSCPTYVTSELIIDNGNAKGLSPQGRFIYQRGEELQIQAPYMGDHIIREIVAAAIEGRQAVQQKSHDVSLEELLEYALDSLNGELSRRKLFEQFKQRGLTVKELETWVAEIEGEQVSVRENNYLVSPPAGNVPRKLVLVKDGEIDGNIQAAENGILQTTNHKPQI